MWNTVGVNDSNKEQSITLSVNVLKLISSLKKVMRSAQLQYQVSTYVTMIQRKHHLSQAINLFQNDIISKRMLCA